MKIFKNHHLVLVIIMGIIALSVLAGVTAKLYQTSLQQQRERLLETAKAQARLIESLASFNLKQFNENALAHTLEQLQQMQDKFGGIGQSGEITIAQRRGDYIAYLIDRRHFAKGDDDRRLIPLVGSEAEPMRQALNGRSGSMIGPDYRGVEVVAAYEPLKYFGFGIVAKIDVSEIREPFISAAINTGLFTVILIAVGGFLFVYVVRHMEQNQLDVDTLFNTTFAITHSGLMLAKANGQVLQCNEALCRMLGHDEHNLSQVSISNLVHPDDKKDVVHLLHLITAGETEHADMKCRFLGKDNTEVMATITVSVIDHFDFDHPLLIAVSQDI